MAADAAIKEWLESLGIATEQEVQSAIGLGALRSLADRLATAQPKDRPGVFDGWVKGLGGTARTLVRHRLGTVSMLALVNALVEAAEQAATELSEPTAVDAFEAFGHHMYQEIANATGVPVHGHMPHPLAAQRSGESIAAALLGQWAAVVDRFGKGLEP